MAVPCWAPAALEVMSSANEFAFEVCTRAVNGTPALLPGLTEVGETSVTRAANTSSPASTAGVSPVSTGVVSLPCAAATSASEPARAMPEYSATAPWKYAVVETDTVMVSPPGAARLFSR